MMLSPCSQGPAGCRVAEQHYYYYYYYYYENRTQGTQIKTKRIEKSKKVHI